MKLFVEGIGILVKCLKKSFFNLVRSATRLVSYGADDVDEDDDPEGAAAEEPKKPGGSDEESPDRPEVCLLIYTSVFTKKSF